MNEFQNADMEMAPLLMSVSRELVMDFIPFYTDYTAFLYKMPVHEHLEYLIFLKPFKMEVWIVIALGVPFAAIAAYMFTKIVVNRRGVKQRNLTPYVFESLYETVTYFYGALFLNSKFYLYYINI